MKNLVRNARSIWTKAERTSLYVIGRGEKTALLTSDEDGELIILPSSKRQIQKFLKQMYKVLPI
ncbi:hypothetical protein P691DRAFT_807852 [Macrolepiota fuliginosa MF-IS2]|uniref:Uncharacterized protein n=1 Tax=Macrolepiota fuliginosa MF-IS2 TaxID=1400762 RepID=A0A9P6BYE5_9AGAR|nr:hypothetical protein P691DRAFT_807852 [Macrolepiota fuliginosa MF-IS2]